MLDSIAAIAGAVGPLKGLGLLYGAARAIQALKPGPAAQRPSDEVRLSPLARALHQAGPGSPGAIRSADEVPAARVRQQENLASFQTELGKLFSDMGVDTTKPIVLELDSAGQLRVANDHPDKGKIEQVLAQTPDLAGRFHQLAGISRMLNTLEQAGTENRPAGPQSNVIRQYRTHGAVSNFQVTIGGGNTP